MDVEFLQFADAQATPSTSTASSEDPAQEQQQQQEKVQASSSSSSSSSSSRGQAGSSEDAGPSEAAQLEALLAMDFRVGKILSCEKHLEADRWVGEFQCSIGGSQHFGVEGTGVAGEAEGLISIRALAVALCQ